LRVKIELLRTTGLQGGCRHGPPAAKKQSVSEEDLCILHTSY
jgi:hypothetical protein